MIFRRARRRLHSHQPGINGRSATRRRSIVPNSRRLRIEPLEDRRLLATVNTLIDVNANDGLTTLREAIAAAAPGETIDFSVTGTINLTSLGNLVVDKNLTINGPGADLLTIKAFDPDLDGANDGDGSRVFIVDNLNNGTFLNVSMSGLTITGGDAGTAGGIQNWENLTLTSCVVTGNAAVNGLGGGIYTSYGHLSVIGCTISGNTAIFGGGIRNGSGITGSVSITDSVVTGNVATDSGGGVQSNRGSISVTRSKISGNEAAFDAGGIQISDGTLNVTNSTIANNRSTQFGGGIWSYNSTANVIGSTISGNIVSGGAPFGGSGGGILQTYGSLNVTSSTISGNASAGFGGGIYTYFGSLTVRHCTIAENRADTDIADVFTLGAGGGIQVYGSTVSLDHTIVAGNTRTLVNRDDIRGTATLTFSLVGDNTGATILGSGNLIGTAATPINPLLGPLTDKGGPTTTRELLPGSPAIDAGNSLAVAGAGGVPSFDQRGAPFGRVFDGDGILGARIDIGAYERQTVPGLNLVVNTLADESDGNYSAGDLSLREAIGLANGSVGANTITFAPSLTSGGPARILLRSGTRTTTNDLDTGELVINDSLTITGPDAHLLTIDASGNDPTPGTNNNDGSRAFNIDDAINSVDNGILINVAISGLTLTGGDSAFNGGAIRTRENLSITSSVISGNASDFRGGGIYNTVGTLMLLSSTIHQNVSRFGGGIANLYGNAVVDRSTIAFNRGENLYGGEGGGIHNDRGNLTVTSSTISGNISEDGGGIHSSTNLTGTQTTTIINSTITGNLASALGGGGAEAGGVYNDAGLTVILHSTITNNTAPAGFGGGVLSKANGMTRTEVHSTIIAGNTNSDVDFVEGLDNSFQSNGFNLIGTGNALADFNQAGDQTGVTNPLLAPLADYGGPTRTHALLPLSLAIDAGNPAAVAGVGGVPLFDQRGVSFTRVFGARIDIGAFEKQNPGTPQSFVVDTLADEVDGNYSAGDFSLREAIGLANANLLIADTISFAPMLAGGTILLKLDELEITDSLTVNGLGANQLTIDASGNDPTPALDNGDGSRVMSVSDFTSSLIDVELVGLTLTGGDVDGGGGAVASAERLSVIDSVVTANAATAGGGGLVSFNFSSDAELSISGSTISNNTTKADGGGVAGVNSSVTIENSTITGNTADENGGGIVSYTSPDYLGALTIVSSTVSGNSAADSGGGIYMYGDGILSVTGSLISGNTASSQGGGIFSVSAQTTVTNSTLSGNTASYGGGVLARYGNLTIIRSTISGNQSPHSNGGGIESVFATLFVANSTISGNTSGAGGGILNYFSTSTINNSTITGNYGSFAGGGINVTGGTLALSHTIVAGNTGVGSTHDDISGPVTPSFSLIGHNTGSGLVEAPIGSPDANGNLIGGPIFGAIIPLLGPLADNGGPTKTHALLAGSPAIDTGHPVFIPFPNVDQRGAPFVRVFGARVDIGAFELQPLPPVAFFGDYNVDGFVDAADYVVWRKTLGTIGVMAYSGADGDGDTTIDQDDYGVWRAHFGLILPPGAGSGAGLEQGAGSAEQVGSLEVGVRSGEQVGNVERGVGNSEFIIARSSLLASADTERQRGTWSRLGERREFAAATLRPRVETPEPERWWDDAMLAWLGSRAGNARHEEYLDNVIVDEPSDESGDSTIDAVDVVFEKLTVEAG